MTDSENDDVMMRLRVQATAHEFILMAFFEQMIATGALSQRDVGEVFAAAKRRARFGLTSERASLRAVSTGVSNDVDRIFERILPGVKPE